MVSYGPFKVNIFTKQKILKSDFDLLLLLHAAGLHAAFRLIAIPKRGNVCH